MTTRLSVAAAAMTFLASPLLAQNLLTNGDFEGGLTGWTQFGNAFLETSNPPQFDPRSGLNLVSMFGNFTGNFNVSGIFQSFPAAPGDSFTMDCWSRHFSGDALVGVGPPNDNWMVMKIAFFDGNGTEISGAEGIILDGTSPTDVWIDNAPVTGTAPTGTASVQALILYLQPLFAGGAGQVDDVEFTKNPPSLAISMAVRETGSTANIGENGGSAGSIEWINRDGQQLFLDGTWQEFTFRLDPTDPNADPVTGFTGDGIINGTAGTLEHIRILNNEGLTDELTLWIDDVANTVNGVPTVFGTFEGYADGTEVMFQEPGNSGSTAGNIAPPPAPNASTVYNYTASRLAPGSDQIRFQFLDSSPTRWIRLTTFNVANQPNPTVRFDQGSIVSFWMRGTTKLQPNLGSQGPGTAIAELVGTGLDVDQQSTLYLAGLPANAPGVISVSVNGFADVPFVGGNLVSFGGFVGIEILNGDANGRATRVIPGFPTPGDIVIQSVHLDASLPSDPPLTFSNAVNALFGQ